MSKTRAVAACVGSALSIDRWSPTIAALAEKASEHRGATEVKSSRAKLPSKFVFSSGAVLLFLLEGCTSSQLGPNRPITVADDVAWTRPLAEPELNTFYTAHPAQQAATRNQIVTARMYIADMEYHNYEARLTREMQSEGFLATATSLGLTTAATLMTPAQTKTILSGVATAVTGLDKAYSEKELLSNTMQALQTQMRADRKAQAAVIYAKMFRDVGSTKAITPIYEYTLPMALSDADAYYQAGTVASALIGLSKTLANAERNADHAKAQSGPNPDLVSDAKELSAPVVRTAVIRSVTEPIVEPRRSPRVEDGVRRGKGEPPLLDSDIKILQRFVCEKPNGQFTNDLRTKVIAELGADKDLARKDRLTQVDITFARGEVSAGRPGRPVCPR